MSSLKASIITNNANTPNKIQKMYTCQSFWFFRIRAFMVICF
ncbi:hypothetical protein PARMER_02703 [Parabacteroides merdae ATCC 43184]|nr:hypothetical protein PARMER_02703 [Parabacteroides merdae ATCC 43184]